MSRDTSKLDKIVLEQCIWMSKQDIPFRFDKDCLIVETTNCSETQKQVLFDFEERKRPYITNENT